MAESKKRGGGPKTENGKANSSQNARKHGCTSKVLILENEDPTDLEAIRAGWWKEFEPEGYQEERLVEILVLNDWWLKRAQRNLDEAEAAVFGVGGDFHRVELMQRYKTTHERAFYRALSALESLRKDIKREKMEMIRLQGRLERSEIEYERLRASMRPESPQAKAPAPRAEAPIPRAEAPIPRVEAPIPRVEASAPRAGVLEPQLFPANEVLMKEPKEMERPSSLRTIATIAD